MLKDGSDSVGALGALNRVYLNIGLFSEEWLRHFNPMLGGKTVTPIQITTARANSAYWQATEAQTPDMALFLVKASYPHKLARTRPAARLSERPAGHGARRASSSSPTTARAAIRAKRPTPPAGADLGACIGPHYLDCWNRYWAWTQTDDFSSQDAPDRFRRTISSTTTICRPTPACRSPCCRPTPAARSRPTRSPAISGTISPPPRTRSLPSVGTITVYDPFTGKPLPYKMPAGGRGYTRVPSLISLWSTAPYLLNNSVGQFEASPSVAARMALVRGFDRPDAVAGQARQGPGARRQGARRDRPHHGDELAARSRRATCPTCSRHRSGC